MNRFVTGMVAMSAIGSALGMASTLPNVSLAIANPDTAAQIVLPDGRLCTYVGPEPRARDLGDPVTYDCGRDRGLRGAVELDGTYMTVDREGRENLDRDAIVESEDIRFLIEEIVLVDGTVCLNAGEGVTLAFDDKRLNYTCGDNRTGLIGDIEISAGGVFQIEKANLNGSALASNEMMTIRRLGAQK